MATAAWQGPSTAKFQRFSSHVRVEGLHHFQHQAVFPAPTFLTDTYTTLQLTQILQKTYYLNPNAAVS